MDKIEIYHYLKRQNIAYEITEHKAVFNMEEADAVDLPYPEWGAKNLFVRDDKKRNYYLITMKGNKRVDLKAFRRQRGLRALSFASAEELFDIMKLIPGAVTPLGILNDAEHRVQVFMDVEFVGNKIGVHPNDNTATVWMQADDLMKIIAPDILFDIKRTKFFNENVKEIYIMPKKFRELMAEGGYDSSDVILRKWKQRNLLDCDPGKNNRKKVINGFSSRVHVVLVEQDGCQSESEVQKRERKILSRTMGRVPNTAVHDLFSED